MGTDGRFARAELLLGTRALERLAAARVCVVGLGAVGSYAVEGLARAGVGHLRLIDCDQVRLSNINRQLYALESTLGHLKTEAARRRVLDINPACRVEVLNLFVDPGTLGEVLKAPLDLVVDAIDSLNPKVELISAAVNAGLPLISAMGAALKMDVSAIRVGSLVDARRCALARHVRKRLKHRNVPFNFECVYSNERPSIAFQAPAAGQGGGDLLDRGRSRNILGSLPTITGVFGLTAANLAIKMLINDEFAKNHKIPEG